MFLVWLILFFENSKGWFHLCCESCDHHMKIEEASLVTNINGVNTRH